MNPPKNSQTKTSQVKPTIKGIVAWNCSLLHPWKLTCPLKRHYFNRKYIFQPLIFRGHVRFRGGKTMLFSERSFKEREFSIFWVTRPIKKQQLAVNFYSYCWWHRNPAFKHQWSLVVNVQGFYFHPKCCSWISEPPTRPTNPTINYDTNPNFMH